jgi:Domain of unknown function (DUF4268)
MYTKAEASAIRQKFWTSFGKYMQPVPTASGEKVNWINYKTGIKGIYFKMDANKDFAYVSIEIFLPDKTLEHLYYQTFRTFTKQFEAVVGEGWKMKEDFLTNDYKSVSIIHTELQNVNIFKESDWPSIIEFLKKNMKALDAFWDLYKPAFELLA